MNSSKSGNVTLSLQAKTVEDAFADESEPFVGREIDPGREVVVLVAPGHAHGPGSTPRVAYERDVAPLSPRRHASR
jgi:hypothetical protein